MTRHSASVLGISYIITRPCLLRRASAIALYHTFSLVMTSPPTIECLFVYTAAKGVTIYSCPCTAAQLNHTVQTLMLLLEVYLLDKHVNPGLQLSF